MRSILIRQKTRAELGIPQNAKLLISVGELSVRKNQKVVIEALNEISDSSMYYIVVGRGPLEKKLKNLDKTGRLKLLEYRTDIVDLLRAADLFIFPSLHEGLPVALMEAMAVGLPIVASKIRGNVDLIDEEQGGFFADSHSPEQFALAIKKVIDGNSDTYIKYNQKIISTFFGYSSVMCKTRELYHDF